MKLTEESLIDHNLSDTNVCCPLSRTQIKQIIENQEKLEKIEELHHRMDKFFKGTDYQWAFNQVKEKLTEILEK